MEQLGIDLLKIGYIHSRSTTPEPISRTATSVPPMLTVPGATNKERSNGQRKTQPIHRSHTVGLDGGETPRTPSPTKSKLNFLEGFKNTLRARSPVRTNSIPVSLLKKKIINYEKQKG